MEFNSWVVMAIGVILSVITGFFVNLQTPRVQTWLDVQRRLRSLRAEKDIYSAVQALHARPHVVPIYSSTNVMVLIMRVAGMLLGGVLLVWLAVTLPESPLNRNFSWLNVAQVGALFLVLFGIIHNYYYAYWLFSRYLAVTQALVDVEAYRDELRKRWPKETWE